MSVAKELVSRVLWGCWSPPIQHPRKCRVSTILCLLLLTGLPLTAHAQRYLINNPPSGNIVIENVVMIDRSGEIEDLNVTLRIKAFVDAPAHVPKTQPQELGPQEILKDWI